MFNTIKRNIKGRKITMAVKYLLSLGIESFGELSFTVANYFDYSVFHSKYGQVFEAEYLSFLSGSFRFHTFRRGSWEDQLLAYVETVRSAEKKKQREDTIARFSDIKEE